MLIESESEAAELCGKWVNTEPEASRERRSSFFAAGCLAMWVRTALVIFLPLSESDVREGIAASAFLMASGLMESPAYSPEVRAGVRWRVFRAPRRTHGLRTQWNSGLRSNTAERYVSS